MRRLAILLALGLGLNTAAVAEEESSDGAELSKVTLGQYWYGPEVDQQTLQGKVSLLVFWGFN